LNFFSSRQQPSKVTLRDASPCLRVTASVKHVLAVRKPARVLLAEAIVIEPTTNLSPK